MIDLSVDRILSVIGAVAGVVGAIAAGIAAYFSIGAPSKKDLERVEQNTGETAKGLEQVRQRLEEQHRQDMLVSEAWKVSIEVKGNGIATEPLTLGFTVQTPGVELTSVELLNEQKMQFGRCECQRREDGFFTCEISPDRARAWYNGGRQLQAFNQRLAQIRAHMRIDGRDAYREFAIHITEASRMGPQGGMFASYIVAGSC